jgi:hypothetical protein
MELPTTISKKPFTTKDYFQLEDILIDTSLKEDKDYFQLENLLAYYPPQNTPKIQTIFTNKKEFNELSTSSTEEIPAKGEFFKHQKLIQRFMRAVDKMLILHEAGTGKTCTMISVGEFYEMMSKTLEGITDSLLRQGSQIKKTYVIVRSPVLKNEFIQQLVCSCTYQKYETQFVKDARDEKTRMKRLKKEIKKWYQVLTYTEFRNLIAVDVKKGVDDKGRAIRELEFKMSDDQIVKEFSNCLFFADEIHNFSNIESETPDDEEEIESLSDVANYDILWKVFHLVQNSKIMLATATPMVNGPDDLVPILNLLLPKDRNLANKTDFSLWSLKKFETYVRGMVSFVRVLDNGIDLDYQGQKIEEAKLVVAGEEVNSENTIELSIMSDFQSKTYLTAEKIASTGLRKPARHASNFVFPKEIIKKKGKLTFNPEEIGIFGQEGFRKYVDFDNDRKTYKFKPEFKAFFEEEENLLQCSSKFLNVIELCEKNPGSSFCYTDTFANFSGAALLGLCFESFFGYERYNTKSPPFSTTGGKSRLTSFCTKDDLNLDPNLQKKILVQPKKRYALLTSLSDDETIRNILTLFNSKENVNGDYIKVIIASVKAREGLNLANVQNIHLVNPGWNQSGMYQAMYRAIRATSHVELLKILKEKAKENNENPDEVRVKINVYQHCSIADLESEEVQNFADEIGIDVDSVEKQMYLWSEQKDRNNSVVMRMLKKCALDCQLHKNRNVRPTDKDNSPSCNYTTCDYECVDPPPASNSLDFSTYDVYYQDELVEKIKKQLIVLFEKKNSYTATEIFDLITEFPAKFILQGISEMIKDKTPFINRYGYTSFLDQDGNQFFLVNELNSYSNEAIENLFGNQLDTVNKTEYNENLYAVGKKDFEDTIRILRKPLDEKKVDRLMKDENLFDKVEDLDPNVLITLLENIIEKKMKKEKINDQEEMVLQKFKKFIFYLNEPLSLMEDIDASQKGTGKSKRGRKRDLTKAPKIKMIKEELDLDSMTFGEPVVVHILNLLIEEKAKYRETTKFEKADVNIRILKESDPKWRDTTDIEKLAYNQLIQNERKIQTRERFGGLPLYGTILQGGKFRIIDKEGEDVRAESNRHHLRKGKMCVTGFDYQKITNIMFRLGLTTDKFKYALGDYPKERKEMEKYLIKESKYKNTEEMSDEELEHSARWVSTGKTKIDLCNLIQEYFDENDLLEKIIG